tara:strand:+ start:36 stop:644 length:609 start_codon:yes stop_codon:yes gene_type:complete
MAYITQNAGYGVDIPGSQDIVGGLYPSYASVTQTGGGKGGYIYQSPVSGKTKHIPDNLSDRRKGRRQMRFDKEERKRLRKESRSSIRKERKRKRLRKESKSSLQKARDVLRSILPQSKRPEDNVEEVDGGGKKRKQIRNKKRGSSKRKNSRVSTLRKKRGSSKRKNRGSLKRKHSKKEVVHSIMKGLSEKRKSRKKSKMRGG